MKGTLKTIHNQYHPHNKTNFNDWSDPKCKLVKRTTNPFEVKKSKVDEAIDMEDKELAHINFSSISNTSLEIHQLRQKIKNGYPLLTRKEIRIIKLPYYESLLLNILDDGFVSTHQFITDLILMDEERHNNQKFESSSNKNQPLLKSSVATLNILCTGLTKAEVAKLEKNKTDEVRLWLEMALHFSKPEQDFWHWLSAELFEQCIAVIDDTDNDESSGDAVDKELKATAQYLYASFLLDVYLDPERAKPLVEESMKLSEGQSWKASKVTGAESDILYLESCLLLHKIYLVMAHLMKERDIEESIKYCRNSLFWAKRISCQEAEGTALLHLAIIHIKGRKYDRVLTYLDQFMSLCVELQDVNGLCEGYILKSEFHEQRGEDHLVVKDIQDLLKVAEENNILQMMAIAHHKLALIYLIQESEKEMLYHAVKAYEYYVILNKTSEIDETRCLTGITQAHEIMQQYLSLILEADNIDTIEFKILTLWKSLHIPFFANVKLFHPEASVNSDLKDRMETTKNEEIKVYSLARQSELLTASIARVQSKLMSKMSSAVSKDALPRDHKVSKPSKSVIDFQRQMKSEGNITFSSGKSFVIL